MSSRSEKHHYLINAIGGRTPSTVNARLKSLLLNRMHGVSFSAYTRNQKPGDEISVEQIEDRMATLSKHFNWVRSFSVTEGNQHIPRVAKTFGIKTLVGAWNYLNLTHVQLWISTKSILKPLISALKIFQGLICHCDESNNDSHLTTSLRLL